MINFKVGNIIDSDADALVNTVNCEGFMGKGIAYQFKLRYPVNNQEYIEACRNGKFYIGTVLAIKEENKVIINFPTKDKWRNPSKYEYIETGLDALIKILPDLNIDSIAIPPLGCGNGGLEWPKVRNILTEKLKPFENFIDITLYEPSHYYNNKVIKKPPKLNYSHLILMKIKMGLVRKNKTTLQKTSFMLNYFLKEEYFKFEKYNYGPYAHSIDLISKHINEFQTYYNLSTEKAIELAESTLISKSSEVKQKSFDIPLTNAINFTNSVPNNKDLELYTSLLYLISKHEPIDKNLLIEYFINWSKYKQDNFPINMIEKGIDALLQKNIIVKDLYGKYATPYTNLKLQQ